MSEKYFLAIDIGASSGRHILGTIKNGKIVLEEIFRFKNGAIKKDGKLVWDIDALFNSILEGLKKCKEIGKIPESLGIDTWGVDYALLDENDLLLDEIFSYRDERTLAVMDEVFSIIPEAELYKRTGIQKQVFNTIFQLYSDKKSGKLKKAKSYLMTPDYLNFLLTGVKANEYTIASTTGLINARTREWDGGILDKLGIKKEIFGELKMPGTVLGNLKPEIAKEVGFDVKVVLPASHDTASAVMAVPSTDKPLYISSGTWSLMGIETQKENTSEESSKLGFTNEGGYERSIRYLKNIMGMWMMQCVKKEFNDKYSFTDFVDEARKVKGEPSVVDANDLSFFSPNSMIDAVKNYCKKTGQKVPETAGEIALCIYTSLAICYKKTLDEIENIVKDTFPVISVVGGGSQNVLMSELTAKYTGRKVECGPVEATAIGNLLAQILASGEIKDLSEGKKLIAKSFEIKEY